MIKCEKIRNDLQQWKVKQLFDYDDINLIWKVDGNRNIKMGCIAGVFNNTNYYIHINYKGSSYLSHRLTYIWHYGKINGNLEIDHINGIRNDNRINNLRLVTKSEQQYNRKNTKGYCWIEKSKKFKASIYAFGKSIYLGRFEKESDARNAYLEAKKEMHVIDGICKGNYKSKYVKKCKGYYFQKRMNKWKVQLIVNGKQKYFGSFSCEEDAQECVLNLKQGN